MVGVGMSHKWARCDPDYQGYDAALCAELQAIERGEEPKPVAQALQPTVMLAGDLVAALTKRIGADRAAKYVADKLGADCHCEERRQKLNALDARVRRFLGW
jgi:hypothetical protein